MENNVIDLSTIEVNKLPELKELKEKQESLVSENPFIEVVDNTTFLEAKKRRTALVSGRTAIQKQDAVIATKIKDFRSRVAEVTKELIAISLPHEEKQQNEVKRYESLKAKEKAEKERLEIERIEKIKNKIDSIHCSWKEKIKELKFDEIEDFQMNDILEDTDLTLFDEFSHSFLKVKEDLKSILEFKVNFLKKAENQRIEDERLKKEREEFENQKRIQEEKEAKNKALRDAEEKRLAEEQKEKQAKIDAENDRKAKELEEKERKIKAEQEALEKEKAEKKAKEEAEKRAKEEAIAKEKEEARIKALAPDKEKIYDYINSIDFSLETPNIKDEELKLFLAKFHENLNILKTTATNSLSKIK